MWIVTCVIGTFNYFLQKDGTGWRWNGLKSNGYAFPSKEEAAKLAIRFYSKRVDTSIINNKSVNI